MGYTHYWRRPEVLDAKTFIEASWDCEKLCKSLPIPLGDGMGEGVPLFNKDMVVFNGAVNSQAFASSSRTGLAWPTEEAEGVGQTGEDAKAGSWCAGEMLTKRMADLDGNGSYETFHVARRQKRGDWDDSPMAFGFCKTNYRPYDLNVQGCLIIFDHFFKDFTVSSDGEKAQWNEAQDACQVFLGYGLDFELAKG